MPDRDPRRAPAPGLPPRRRPLPDMRGWVEDPPDVRSGHGAPADDEARWWRLQPGERGEDGTMLRRSVVHGATCVDWPAGRHPEGWTHLTRPEVRRLLGRPDEVTPCPLCRPWVGL